MSRVFCLATSYLLLPSCYFAPMKTIGLLGGMSWESSIEYERIINTEVRRRLGGVHSADLLCLWRHLYQRRTVPEEGDWDTAVLCWCRFCRYVS